MERRLRTTVLSYAETACDGDQSANDNTRIQTRPRSGHSQAFQMGKRSFDLFIVLAAAPAALFLVAIAAAAIILSSGLPVFFVQERVGRGGRVFRMIKLRTMISSNSETIAASISDRRITPLGKTLRGYRIDELPQLLNILRGDMSFVGPRPEQPALVDKYRREIPAFDERHAVKPGLTGLAQVMYGYASDSKETRIKLRYDRFYVRKACLWLEAIILVKTVRTVLKQEGVR